MDVVDVLVFEPDGTTFIAMVADIIDVTALEELEDVGGGSLTIAKDNPTLVAHPTLLAYRNVVKVRVDQVVRAAWYIDKTADTVVGSGAAASKAITASGPGLLAWLKDAVLYPENFTSYAAGTRWFNWGSKTGTWYDSTQWGSPLKVRARGGSDFAAAANPWKGCPANWPYIGDTTAWWIWDRATADVTAPAGSVYFRTTINSPADGTAFRLYITADTGCDVVLDGEPLMRLRYRNGYQRTYEVDFDLDTGNHILGIRGINNVASPAGLLAAVFRYPGSDPNASTATLAQYTGNSGWACLAYPEHEPGWTAGEVLRTLFAEAAARDVAMANRLTVGFSNTLDSDDVAWTHYPWSFNVGDTYWDICTQMADRDLQVSLDPDGLVWNGHNGRGTNRSDTVVVEAGSHIIDATEEVEVALANALFVAQQENYVLTSDPTSIATYGRIEAFLDVSSLDDISAGRVATAVLEKAKIPTTGVAVTYTPTAQNQPWSTFGVGDFIGVSNASGGHTARRVQSIAVTINKTTGLAEYTVELDAVSKSLLDRIQHYIDNNSRPSNSVGGRASESRGSNPSNHIPTPDGGGGGPGYRKPIPTTTTDNPWVPPDDPSGGSDQVLDVGDVSRTVAEDMVAVWDTYGDPLYIALCTAEPAVTAGEWADPDSTTEVQGEGYARLPVQLSQLSTPVGHDPVWRANDESLVFQPNSGFVDWDPITHVAILSHIGTCLSVVPLSVPLNVGPNEALVIALGDLQFSVGSL